MKTIVLESRLRSDEKILWECACGAELASEKNLEKHWERNVCGSICGRKVICRIRKVSR